MERILIIGSGFDESLGLKASYGAFLGSDAFKALIQENNLLAQYLQYKGNTKKWVDVEHELKNYANGIVGLFPEIDEYLRGCVHPTNDTVGFVINNNQTADYDEVRCCGKLFPIRREIFKSEFVALKQALHEHLNIELSALDSNGIGKTNAFRLLKFGTLFDAEGQYYDFNFADNIDKQKFSEIFTFNYTNPLSKVGFTNSEHGVEPYFVHGSLSQNNIIFGVEDDSVPDEFNFLLKSDHAAFGLAPDLLLTISNKAREFHFFGCSLGDTDNAHFVDFFSTLAKTCDAMNEVTPKHKLFFYVYGKSGYQEIRNRILHLTSGQLARFKLNHDVIFYDIHSDSNQIVNQDYLNQL